MNTVPKCQGARVPRCLGAKVLEGASVVAALILCAACETTYFETPTSSSTTTATGDPKKFDSQIVRGGSATRAFTLSAAGTIDVMLTSVTPSVRLGVGIGIPRSDGNGCNLSRSVETHAGSSPQVSAAADAGSYCLKVFDIGEIEESASFSLVVAYP